MVFDFIKGRISLQGSAQGIAKKIPSEYLKEKDNLDGNSAKFDYYDSTLDKKKKFEHFLTYRKRLTRLAFVQAVYLFEMQTLTQDDQSDSETSNITLDSVVRPIIYIYKNIFFAEKYGNISKKKKLDEKFIYTSVSHFMGVIKEVDKIVSVEIKDKNSYLRIDPVIRAILRAGCYELFFLTEEINSKIIVSEYTTLSTAFYKHDDKSTGFINAILDKLGKKAIEQNKL